LVIIIAAAVVLYYKFRPVPPDPIPDSKTTYTETNADIINCVVPEGYTAIADGGFNIATSLKSVTLPASMQSIGDKAFYKSTIQSITFPDLIPDESSK
jgi:hypothetical protein